MFGGLIAVIGQRLTLRYNHKKSSERFRLERFECAVAEFLVALDTFKQEVSFGNFCAVKSKGFVCKAWGTNNITVLIDFAVGNLEQRKHLPLGWEDEFLIAVKQELGLLKEYANERLNAN